MARVYFDKTFDFIFKPEKNQIMLEVFSVKPEFTRFFDGLQLLELYTKDRAKLEGYLTRTSDGKINFSIQSSNRSLPMEVGDVVLLVPQQKPHVILVQALIQQVADGNVSLENVDPRRRSRYRTRILGAMHVADSEQMGHLKSHSLHIFRQVDLSRSTMEKPYIAKVSDMAEDASKAVVNCAALIGKGRPPSKILVADLSEGGACIYVETDANVNHLIENDIIFLMFELPHPSKTQLVHVLASIRKKRKKDGGYLMHCMFVDALPKDILDV